MTEPRERKGQSPQQPERFISDNPSIEVLFPKLLARLHLTIHPDKTVSFNVVDLSRTDQDRLEAETNFTRLVRDLFGGVIRHTFSRAGSGEDEVARELDVFDFEKPFRQGITVLDDMDFSKARIVEMIEGQGRLFTVGQEYMGSMSPPIKEEIARLNGIVTGYFDDKEKKRSQSQLQIRRRLSL